MVLVFDRNKGVGQGGNGIGFAQGDVLDLASNAFAFDDITIAHFLAQHDQHAGEEVFENILECKTDRNRADPKACDQAGGREARKHNNHRQHQADQPDGQLHQCVDQVFQAGAQAAFAGYCVRDTDREFGDQPSYNQDNQRDDQAWQCGNEAFGHALQLAHNRIDVVHAG